MDETIYVIYMVQFDIALEVWFSIYCWDCDRPLLKYILGQKRNAAYKTSIVYGGLSPISRKRCVKVGALILGL